MNVYHTPQYQAYRQECAFVFSEEHRSSLPGKTELLSEGYSVRTDYYTGQGRYQEGKPAHGTGVVKLRPIEQGDGLRPQDIGVVGILLHAPVAVVLLPGAGNRRQLNFDTCYPLIKGDRSRDKAAQVFRPREDRCQIP